MDVIATILIGETDLTPLNFFILCGVSFFGSFVAAALGLGGGILVIATMALVLPPTALIPLHGLVQLGSNMGRAALMVRSILTSILPAFVAGSVLGAVVGAQVVVSLPTAFLQVVLALFILYATWAPKFHAHTPTKRTFFILGSLSSFTTMFIGATGPLVAPFAAAAGKERGQVVATHATLMTIQHMLKVVAFGVLGFSFGPYLPLLVALIGFGFFGTIIGRAMLHRLPERVFRMGLKTILTLISLRLLYDAMGT